MIKKLLFAASILFSAAMHAQATAYPAPAIFTCYNMYVDLTQQTPIVLGNQSPAGYNVGYFTSEADAASNVNEISLPELYYPVNSFTMIYVRVSNLSTQEFAIGSFYISASEQPPAMSDVSACGSYTLPPCNCFYTVNGVFASPGTVITETSVVENSTNSGCVGSQFLVTIGNPVANVTQPLVSCDDNDDGFTLFDLTSAEPQITGGMQGETVSFHETQIDAATGSNPVTSPYQNIDAINQTIYVRVQSGDCYTIAPMQLQVVQCGTISGTVRIDTDGNGCSASDPGALNQLVERTFGNHYFYAYTDAQGQYAFTNVLPGNSVVYVPMNAFFGTVSPGAQTIDVTSNANYTADFCITPAAPINDAAVYFFPTINARPGFPAHYKLLVQNKGNLATSGTVTVTYDEGRLNFDLATPAQTAQSGGSLTFNYTLPALAMQSFTLDFTVENPPAAQLDDLLFFVAQINTSDDDMANNMRSYGQTIVSSLDPNDKWVSDETVAPSQYLQYVVNFQNTGTAAANTVKITDQLDPNLDWTTFRPVSASHAFAAEMTDTGEVTFTFSNINLPAASADEPASHGYVIYEAQTTAGAHANDTVENTASIYFDFNAPIITNTVTTYFVSLGLDSHDMTDMTLYPNPSNGQVTLQWADTFHGTGIEVTDLQGKAVLRQATDLNQATLDVSGLAAGLYVVKVQAGDKSAVRKLVKE